MTQTTNPTMYLVFSFDSYYPAGGMEDCKAMFTDEAEAIACAEQIKAGTWRGTEGYIAESDNGQVAKLTKDGIEVISAWTSFASDDSTGLKVAVSA